MGSLLGVSTDQVSTEKTPGPRVSSSTRIAPQTTGGEDVYESPERPAREVHRPYVSPAHDGIAFVVRDSHHQIVSNDAAAHPTHVQECETTEHLAFSDVLPRAKCLANPIRELLEVRHWLLSLTVRHLLAVIACMEFQEAHVVCHGHGTEDGRSHSPAARGGLPAGLVELLVRRLEANASLCCRLKSAPPVYANRWSLENGRCACVSCSCRKIQTFQT
jgi:hypothetical protein